MTVCGIEHADGVCVMGECPHFKKCCPAVWDKSGKPMTNEEWLRQASTEELAEMLTDIQEDGFFRTGCMTYEERVEWLKEIHE